MKPKIPKKQTGKTIYNAPDYIILRVQQTPAGYIRNVPVKGTISPRRIAAAVKKAIAARPYSPALHTYTISVPRSLISKGKSVKIVNAIPAKHLSR